ncbi:MAG TPA: hypothetical protein DIT07_16185, partial [Sphingobacteriaceae bacterium]|nr:hypothetical protein [Sphingobacteriaceae bacterium]
ILSFCLQNDNIAASSDTLHIFLDEISSELDEIVVSSTRSTRTISDIPTRVEVIAGEELDEKGNMKPGDIKMLLNESTGIQVQQTSATSANASIRIQGLDGRYTQILKDGFPVYSGAASGLGLLQIPPLDLKQVEVIKGSASTLYGGGAIAGLVNLISKTPTDEPQLNFQLNATSAKGLDLNGFYGQKFKKVGLTIFASRNSNAAYDPSNLDLTAIPKFERYTINPKLFLYFNDKTELNFGVNSSFENRIGGDLHYIEGDGDITHSYFEKNKTQRLSTQFSLTHQINNSSKVLIKNSISYFNRNIQIPSYEFEGRQYGSYTEVNYTHYNDHSEWIAGVNAVTDQFKETKLTSTPVRDYSQTIIGMFIQNNYKASKVLTIETGLRGDYVIDYGFAFLPRISTLFKFNDKFSSRLTGGFGYKTPTIFTEESERIQYQNVLPVSSKQNKLEKSYGLNLDGNYKTALFNNQVSFSINHMLFYTYLNNPLAMVPISGNQVQFRNITGHLDTKGMETNIKLGYQDFKLLLGYTLTDAKIHENGVLTPNTLTSKHRLNNVLMYEVDDKWKLGAEAYYFSKQQLNDGTTGKSYWTCGFMAEKLWERFSIYINFENFTDTRQTRFDTIYTGSISNPTFRDIYAPLDGFVINGGVKLKF